MSYVEKIKSTLREVGEDATPILVCPGRDEIERIVHNEIRLDRIFRKEMRSMNTRIMNRCDGLEEIKGNHIGPQKALVFLKNMHSIVERGCELILNDKSVYRYIWISRRFPWGFFEGEYATTQLYREDLTNALIYKYGNFEADLSYLGVTVDNPEVPVLFNKAGVREFAKFVVHVIALDSIHTGIRWSGKDCRFEVMEGAMEVSPLKALPDEDLRTAVDFFDNRAARASGNIQDHLLQRTGTAIETGKLLEKDSVEEIESSGSVIWLYSRAQIDEMVPIPMFFGEEDQLIKSNPNYFPLLVSLDDFSDINTDDRAPDSSLWDPTLPGALLLSRLCLLYSYYHEVKVDTCFNFGYLIIDYRMAKEMYQNSRSYLIGNLGEIFPNLNFEVEFDEIIDQSMDRSSSILPLHNKSYVSKIEPVGNLCVDLHSLFAYIRKSLEYPPEDGNQIASVRGDHFEIATQRRLDRSPWGAPERYRNVRGRHLRKNEDYITDIDSIGYKNGSLLLVDTKSRVFRSEYDAGDYDKVRNLKTNLVKQARKWKEKVEFIRENPEGDNYDFSDCDEIFGVICVPTPIYVPLGVATEEVREKLMRVCTLSELRDWVDGNRDRLLSGP